MLLFNYKKGIYAKNTFMSKDMSMVPKTSGKFKAVVYII